jgi:hypothetical protein
VNLLVSGAVASQQPALCAQALARVLIVRKPGTEPVNLRPDCDTSNPEARAAGKMPGP